ncbi:biliverdin-producing heme oxygenase [Dyadobacter pollutisoli]|jgi:heme oxygenase|uniref:Biliverdin-producing heme oxygenase n=1 Tax=Dyadobacter pollutisoli TaxID=2910158 RepID=A0A9E8N968_9BACT|nr:biliverdin-producing heme oxygenase [Dyadobacter pollutisoli]WAC10331.1 biliverdin-producing heme oxygenase [Dyadobacter pollutisoli]
MSETTVFKNDQDLFIKNLRQETAASHQQLEENRLSKAILSPSVSLSDYQAYLSALYAVTIACEDQVFPAISAIIPDLQDRYKSNKIIEDLSFTGMSDVQIDALPVCRFEFSSPSEALGIMYVIEGSTLGGRILYKHIHETLGFDPERGAAYFWGYGTQTGILWKSFISAFSQFAVENDNSSQITDSAVKTFIIIDNWLSKQ